MYDGRSAAIMDGRMVGRRRSRKQEFLWVWSLKRSGRRDGRRGQPDPTLAVDSTTTGARLLLAKQLTMELGDVHEICANEIRRRAERIGALCASTEQLWAKLNEDDPPIQRRLGEMHLPEALVRTRRQRERERRRTPLVNRLNLLEQEIAGLVAEIQGHRLQAVSTARRLQAQFQRYRGMYDEALLRRHPQAELVRPVLDQSVPELPDWVAEYEQQPFDPVSYLRTEFAGADG